MKGLGKIVLVILGLVAFMALGPFAIFPAVAGLVFISRMGTALHTSTEQEKEVGMAPTTA